jgi:hypothetical protein
MPCSPVVSMRLSWIVQVQREAGEDAVVAPGDRGAAVVVREAVLDDHAARVAAVVLLPRMAMPERGAPETSKPSMVMKLHDASCTKSSLEPLRRRGDLRAPAVARPEHDAGRGRSGHAVAGEPGVGPVLDGDDVTRPWSS